jgi:hypothetical protein
MPIIAGRCRCLPWEVVVMRLRVVRSVGVGVGVPVAVPRIALLLRSRSTERLLAGRVVVRQSDDQAVEQVNPAEKQGGQAREGLGKQGNPSESDG